jgi:hypothetical protein
LNILVIKQTVTLLQLLSVQGTEKEQERERVSEHSRSFFYNHFHTQTFFELPKTPMALRMNCMGSVDGVVATLLLSSNFVRRSPKLSLTIVALVKLFAIFQYQVFSFAGKPLSLFPLLSGQTLAPIMNPE